MTPLEMIAEFQRGCTNTLTGQAHDCPECVEAFYRALRVALAPQDTKVGPWRIWYDPPPIGTRLMDWHYQHEDCDGPESPVWMTGHCASREACLSDIMDQLDDRAERAEATLKEIGDKAHDWSTGPAVPDAFWELRCLAYGVKGDRP